MNMLNGIEVLNWEYINKDFPTWLLGIVVLFLMVGVCCLFGENFRMKLIGLISSLCCLICFICGIVYCKEPSDIKQYQVTISDDVSMVEFNEKYDVIKVEGKIYTIREKEM